MELELKNGGTTSIDDSDYPDVSRFTWRWKIPNKSKKKYVFRTNGSMSLHRYLMHADRGEQVDHIDRDPLNNRRYNLRLCTSSQNKANRSHYNKTGYKGVCQYTSKGIYTYYRADCKKDGKSYYCGSFKTAEEAAAAYDAKALELHGEFARLNFPPTR